jgi:hypothetical protein
MPAANWKDLMNKAEEGAKEFAILDEGMYAFVVKDPAKVGQTSKENPKFTINPSVESGPRANARVFHDFIVSDSPYAMKNFFFGDLAILGLGVEFFNTNPSEQQIAQALQGRRFVAEVYHEEGNNGKTYARLRNFAAPTSAPPGAGVPGGLPSAGPVPNVTAQVASPGPVAQAAPAPASPWDTVPQAVPAPVASNTVPMPPAFGG